MKKVRVLISLSVVLMLFVISGMASFALGGIPNRSQLSARPNPQDRALVHRIPKQRAGSFAGISEKRILFIEDKQLLSNTDWDGLSDLKEMLTSMGLEVRDTFPNKITYSLVSNYDVVVFSVNWSNLGYGQREISDAEAQALIDFVDNGGKLFLIGTYGLSSGWSPAWTNSVNKVGKAFGIEFQMDMLCDPTDHYDYPSDPDGGVDMPFITQMSPHPVTSDVSKFMLGWGCSLRVTSPAKAIAISDSDSWCDRNGTWDINIKQWECYRDYDEPSDSYPVLAVATTSSGGRVVAIGGGGWMINAWLNYYDHYQLAENIFSWLADINQAPIIGSCSYSVYVGGTVTFTCQAHDPDGNITQYQWDFDGDGIVDQTTSNGTASYTYSKAGTYQARVTVVDDKGGETTSGPLTITVGSPSLPGDCNGDGNITIDEVQRCINCFLGIQNSCCDKSDLDNSGQVTIDEVQKVINAFLGK